MAHLYLTNIAVTCIWFQFLSVEHYDGYLAVEYALGHQPGRLCDGNFAAACHGRTNVVYKL